MEHGIAGESLIARWLLSRGNRILPAYEKILDDRKGPRLYTPIQTLIAPDLLVFNASRVVWVEAKHKTAFSYHRLTGDWVTGIDLRHYQDYCRVADETPWPVWLFFLHEGGYGVGNPTKESPSGLFGNALSHLRKYEHHRHEHFNYGRGGVFWSIDTLRQLATLDEVIGNLKGAA